MKLSYCCQDEHHALVDFIELTFLALKILLFVIFLQLKACFQRHVLHLCNGNGQ